MAGGDFSPRGLRVLLVDADAEARLEAEGQLKGCGYLVQACSSAAEAADRLNHPGAQASFDVIVMDVSLVPSGEGATAITRSRVPLILTSANPNPADVMHGISQLGAVDFLEKPLPQLKLVNIWQHKVRRMLSGIQTGSSTSPKKVTALRRSQSAAAQQLQTRPLQAELLLGAEAHEGDGHQAAQQARPADQQQQQQQHSVGSHSGPGNTLSASNGAESASAASTSEALRGSDMLAPGSGADADNSSPLGLARLDSGQVAGLTCGFSHLIMDEKELVAAALALGQQQQQQSCAAPSSGGMPPRRAQSAMLPGEHSTTPPLLVMGHASGQLPALPEGQGIVWGLPTTPLHIAPPRQAMPPFPMMGPHPGCMPLPPMPMLMPPHLMMPPPFLPGMMPPGMPPLDPLMSGFPIAPMLDPSAVPHHLMNPGMIPTPMAASPAPHMMAGEQQGTAPTPAPTPVPLSHKSRKAAGHAKRPASTPLPQHQFLADLPPPGPSSSMHHIPGGSALLDPLSVLDDPLGVLEPLDPMLLTGGAVSGDGGYRGGGGGQVGGDSAGGDLMEEDWLMTTTAACAEQRHAQPLGLTLHKTPSLLDMLCATMDHTAAEPASSAPAPVPQQQQAGSGDVDMRAATKQPAPLPATRSSARRQAAVASG